VVGNGMTSVLYLHVLYEVHKVGLAFVLEKIFGELFGCHLLNVFQLFKLLPVRVIGPNITHYFLDLGHDSLGEIFFYEVFNRHNVIFFDTHLSVEFYEICFKFIIVLTRFLAVLLVIFHIGEVAADRLDLETEAVKFGHEHIFVGF